MSHLYRVRFLLLTAALLAAVGCRPNAGPAKPPAVQAPGPQVADNTPPVFTPALPAGPTPLADPGVKPPVVNPPPADPVKPPPLNPPDNPNPGPKGVDVKPPAPVDPPPAATGGRRFALLVGVKDYDSPDFRNLNFTEADVEDLAQTLRGDDYAAGNIIVMTKKHGADDPKLMPTVENIRDQLDRLLKRAGKDDVVLVALTGHGIQPKDGKQFFCGYKAVLADAKEAQPKTLLPIEEVYQKLGACSATLKLLLVDACRDDPESKGARRVSDDFKTVTSGPTQAGVIALYSCSEGESSWEPTELQHGVFFHFLIQGLQGKADLHHDGRITWTELVDYLVSNVDLYAVSRLRQRQRPHFKGESNVQEPLAIRPAANDPMVVKAPDVKLKAWEGLLMNEDFRETTLGGQPKGWDGDAFSAVKDKEGRVCLEVNKEDGTPFITLPRLPIKGDFFVEVEVLLDGALGWEGYKGQHELRVELEAASGAVHVPVLFTNQGWVTVQNSRKATPAHYKPYQVTRVRLTREGKVYKVTVNEEYTMGETLDYTGDFDTVRLALTAGVLRQGGTLGTSAKIYSVKVGGVNNAGMPPMVVSNDRLLLNEDFKGASLGGPPKGWDGDAFSVVKDKNDRFCLEINKPGGTFFVTPPRVALKGDFYVEAEILLDGAAGWEGYAGQHEIQIVLEARGGAIRVPITVVNQGLANIGVGGQKKKPEHYKPYEPTRVRVMREGKVYRVALNGEDAIGVPLDYTGDFDTVRLGLTGGVLRNGGTLGTTAKIYSVRIGMPGDGPIPPAPPALPDGIREDFGKAKIGTLPDGWTGSPLNNLTVQKNGEYNDLELTNPLNGGDLVVLPKTALKGDFFIEYGIELPSEETAVTLQLSGGPKVRPLLLQLDGHGKLSAPNVPTADLSKTFAANGKPNVLGIEHTDKGYFIKLNETQVGALPAAAGPGPYDTIGLAVGLKDKNQKSPHINFVRVQPLDMPPMP